LITIEIPISQSF